jgi:hypothetical protein
MAYKTKFQPQKPEKYVGNPDKIICRSLWERKFCKYLDNNDKIIRWSSEEIAVPYVSTVDKSVHKYYPDFIFEVNKGNEVVTYMVEIKPEKQTKPPKPRKNKKSYLQEAVQYEINTCKWKAAQIYCKNNGWVFKILTEKDLFKG